jgi:hypothetical protein
MIQIVRKSNRLSYAIINGIFGVAGMLLLFLVLAEWWTAVLEKVSTVGITPFTLDLLRRTVIDEIVLRIPFTKCSTCIGKTVDNPIAFYTDRRIF